MSKFSAVLLAATLATLSVQAQAISPSSATASIDWSKFEIRLIDLDLTDGITPSLTWDNRWTRVTADGASYLQDLAPDWTTAISAIDGATQAFADSNSQLANVDGVGSGNAWSDRFGDFTLSSNTLVLFSVAADAHIFGGVDQYAAAHLDAFGQGALGNGEQSSHSSVWADMSSASESAILSASFINLTTGNLAGSVAGTVYASAPVPEPDVYGMMLVGIGLVAWVIRRHKA